MKWGKLDNYDYSYPNCGFIKLSENEIVDKSI